MKDKAKRMMALFAGLPRAHGIYTVTSDPAAPGKKKGKGLTVQEPVTVELWERHLRGEIQLGIVPIRDDATCAFGAIDVDDYNVDHAALSAKIKKAKLPLVMCRSKSGGAHLYGFFAPGTSAEAARELLSDWAAQLGHANVEIFPKQNRLHSLSDTGNWINMPYSGGDASERHCLRDNKPLTIEQFLEYAQTRRIGPKHFVQAVAAQPEMLADGPPCLITLSAQGFPQGTRNSGLFALGVYCRRRWPKDWEAHVIEMNDKFMSPPLEQDEIAEVINHLQRKDYTYSCKTPPIAAVCQRATCIKRLYGIGPGDAQDVFGLAIEHISRLEVDPPVYFADFNGKRIQFHAEHINSQGAMRNLLINQVNEVLQPINQNKWYQYWAQACSNAEVVAAPPETSRQAMMVALAEDYCLEQVPGQAWEDIIDGQTYVDADRVHFLPHKFVRAVNKEHHLHITNTDAFTALLPLDVKSEKRKIGEKEYAVWSLPAFKRPTRKLNGEDKM